MSTLLSNPTLGDHPAAPRGPGRLTERAAALLDGLTLPAKIGQLLMPRIGGGYLPRDSAEYERLAQWVSELRVGGVIVGMGPPLEIAARLDALQALAPLPLLVAADVESGPGRVLAGGVLLPHRLENGGGTRFPPLMAIGATGDEGCARELGRITALECRAVGIHVAFAPVADVNSNPRNPIINTRSYGGDAGSVAAFVAAHVRGLQDYGMIATPKHFPGHGDTTADSHVELPFTDADESRLREVELVPFRAAIAAGAGALMTGHIAIPSLTGGRTPATLHPRIVTTLLREDLGFDGLVFSDGLDMGAITRELGTASACVLALKAGVDVLLQPPSEQVMFAIDAVVAAVRRNEITESRIDASVLRVLRAKERLGLLDGARVPLEDVPSSVGARAHIAIAENAGARGITVLRNEGDLLPLRAGRVGLVLHTEEYDPLAGAAFVKELQRHIAVLDIIDPLCVAEPSADSPVIFAAFTRSVVGTDATALDEQIAAAMTALARRAPLLVVSFGNPYLLPRFADAAVHVAAWAAWEPMQSAAARALCGVVAATGRLPIDVPPLYTIGDGLQLERVR